MYHEYLLQYNWSLRGELGIVWHQRCVPLTSPPPPSPHHINVASKPPRPKFKFMQYAVTCHLRMRAQMLQVLMDGEAWSDNKTLSISLYKML